MKNKVLAMLLALCMVMSLLPVTVFAEATKPSTQAPCTCGCTNSECTSCSKAENADTWTCECTSAQGQTPGKGCGGNCKYKACGVEGCADAETILDSTAHTEHTFTCVCEGCDGAEGKTCCVQNNQAGTYTAAAKSENGLCENCVAVEEDDDDTIVPCEEKGCVLEKDHRFDHQFACACKGQEDGCTSVTHDDTCATVAVKGEKCLSCQKSIEVNAAIAAAEEDEPVSCATPDGEDPVVGNDGCTSEKHQDGCPKKCDVGDCTLTKGDHTTHNNTTCLAGKPGCNPKLKAEDHDIACDLYELEPAEAGFDSAKDYVEVTFTVKCGCEDEDHEGHDECAGDPEDNGDGVEVTVKYYFPYSWPIMNPDTFEPFTDAQIATIKAEALRVAKLGAEDEAKKDNNAKAIEAAKAQLGDDYDLCAACKAAEDEEETLDPEVVEEQLKLCTSAYDCPAGKVSSVSGEEQQIENNAAYHHDDCLSLCTMGTDCENTEGDSLVHRTQYWVYRATYKNTLDPEDNRIITKTVRTEAPTAVGIGFPTLAEAQAYRASLPEAEAKANNAQVWYAYSIRNIHCPMAKVPDGVVVNEEGEVLETPEVVEPETKAPEKATDFEDVKEGAWYIPELNALMAKGIVKGSLDGGVYRFKATDKMTTDYLVVFLSRVLDKGLKTEGAGWADEANAWAKEEGLLDGIEAGEIDRKDVVLVLWRAMGKTEAEQDLSKFEDAAGLEGDHLAAMQWAVSAGVVKGDGDTGTLKTDDVITRAEMIAMLARLDVSEK